MGRIHFAGTNLYDALIEMVGYKCGVAIDYDRLIEILNESGWPEYADLTDESYLRIESIDYEHVSHDLMRVFGRSEGSFSPYPHIALMHKYKIDPRLFSIYNDCMNLSTRWIRQESKKIDRSKKILDPRKLLVDVESKHGPDGLAIMCEILLGLNAMQITNPWGFNRQIEWKNQIELQDLFKSEGLDVAYGSFIDQRFIDYLHKNFDNIDKMHWRKFEQLTAEFLEREGYQVELGPGRGDDGVDVRAWNREGTKQSPLIIAQCKRQKAAVEKVVVKSLYADVLDEKATSGLLVTTSRLSPGANETRLARSYPIDVADRATLAQWLRSMRVPGVGGDLFPN